MTQQIRNVEDIITVLETDPKVRKRVFEAMGLPAYIGDAVITPLTDRIDRMAAETNARFDAIDARFDRMESQTNARFDAVDARFDRMESETNARFDRVESSLADVRSVVFGDHFERAVRDELPARLGEVLLDSTEVRILVSRVDGTGVHDGFFREGIQRAEDQGLLPDPANRLRLIQTDLVLSAKVAGDTWILPVEVSATIDNDDVSRVHRSAVLIRDIFATDSLPVVAGPAIRAATRQYAEREGVAIVILGAETRNQEPDAAQQTQ